MAGDGVSLHQRGGRSPSEESGGDQKSCFEESHPLQKAGRPSRFHPGGAGGMGPDVSGSVTG